MVETVRNEASLHVRIDPETGAKNYYFPMEITSDSVRADARAEGLEICRTRLGFRVFDAVMVPCKDFIVINGKTEYIPTPEEKQHKRYLALIRDELNDQEKMKEDGRCNIPDGNGGTKRCPCRMPNPDYSPTNGQPKTIPVKCEGCKYETIKQAHTVIEMSCLDHKDENGELEYYEPAAPADYIAGEQYEYLVKQFLEFVGKKEPQLVELAKLKTAGYSRLECSKILGEARSTAGDHMKKLRKLATEFLDNAIIF